MRVFLFALPINGTGVSVKSCCLAVIFLTVALSNKSNPSVSACLNPHVEERLKLQRPSVVILAPAVTAETKNASA